MYTASYDMIQGRVAFVPCFKLINESNGALASSIHGNLPDMKSNKIERLHGGGNKDVQRKKKSERRKVKEEE